MRYRVRVRIEIDEEYFVEADDASHAEAQAEDQAVDEYGLDCSIKVMEIHPKEPDEAL